MVGVSDVASSGRTTSGGAACTAVAKTANAATARRFRRIMKQAIMRQ
jgi:hypothetical protein